MCICIEYTLFRQPIIIGQVKLYLTLIKLNFEPINNFYLVILSKKNNNLYLVLTLKMRRKKTFSIFWLMQKASTFGPFGSLKLKNRPQIWSLCKKLCGKTTYLTKKYHLGKSQRLSQLEKLLLFLCLVATLKMNKKNIFHYCLTHMKTYFLGGSFGSIN